MCVCKVCCAFDNDDQRIEMMPLSQNHNKLHYFRSRPLGSWPANITAARKSNVWTSESETNPVWAANSSQFCAPENNMYSRKKRREVILPGPLETHRSYRCVRCWQLPETRPTLKWLRWIIRTYFTFKYKQLPKNDTCHNYYRGGAWSNKIKIN